MSYEKQTWVNRDLTKPLNDGRMNHIEDGIFEAAATADAALAAAGGGVDAVTSPTIGRIVVSEDPDEPLSDGDLLVVVPTGTLDVTGPSVPTGLSATPSSTTVINLAWSASTDNIAVTGYEYRIDSGAAVDAGAGVAESVTGLTAATFYTFHVRAYDAAGNRSGWSAAATATTSSSSDVTAPSTPTGLNATATGTTTVDLAWSASTDAVGVTGYEYRINGGSAVDAGAGLSESVTGLTAATSYTFEVRAYDAAGNRSGWSASDSATTTGAPTFTEHFTANTLETAPAGWTSRWATFTTLLVKEDLTTSDDKVLRLVAAGSSSRAAASYDAVGATHADVEVLGRYKPAASSGAGRILLRGSGASGAETGILGYVSTTGTVTVGQYNAAAASSLSPTGTGPGAPNNASWYRIRFRALGDQAYLKIWNESGAEPGAWQVQVTIPNVLSAGWVGIMGFNGGSTDFDWITVAFDGDTAPTPS
jgi:chitodextrinase